MLNLYNRFGLKSMYRKMPKLAHTKEPLISRSQAKQNQSKYHTALKSIPLELPVDYRFTVELWRYPYTTARYYGISEDELFGEKHTEILREHLREYKRAGGDAITTTVTRDPWNHQTYDKYPGMVKWTKHEDGTFSFAFTQFDKYVTIAEEEGVAEKIRAFSMLPWNNQVRYYEEAEGKNITKQWTSGTPAWEDAWGQFLEAFVAHLGEKGWFDKTYIALDEHPINELGAVIDLVNMYPNKEGKIIKISAAINSGATDRDILNELDDVSISMDELADKEDVRDFIAERQAAGKTTTMYSMVGQYPNSFTRSNPIEAAWVLLYARSLGFDGYMRWAYDAWVEDPLTSVDHWYWESGDPFFIYPSDDDTSYAPDSSPRYEWLKEAYRLIDKINFLEENYPESKQVFKEFFDTWEKPEGKTNDYGAMESGSKEQEEKVESDVRELIQLVNRLSRQYIESMGENESEQIIPDNKEDENSTADNENQTSNDENSTPDDENMPSEDEITEDEEPSTELEGSQIPDNAKQPEGNMHDISVENMSSEQPGNQHDSSTKVAYAYAVTETAEESEKLADKTITANSNSSLPQTGLATVGLGLGLLLTTTGTVFMKKKR